MVDLEQWIRIKTELTDIEMETPAEGMKWDWQDDTTGQIYNTNSHTHVVCPSHRQRRPSLLQRSALPLWFWQGQRRGNIGRHRAGRLLTQPDTARQ